MSTTGQNIVNQINRWVRNYAVEAFHDMRLNSILLQIVAFLESLSGGTATVAAMVPVTSADFINATDCPLTLLNGKNLNIYWNEGNKYLEKDAGEWTDLVGGGFRVLVTDFDATAAPAHIKVFIV